MSRPSPEPLPAPEPLPLSVVSLSLTVFDVLVAELLTELEDESPIKVIELPARLIGIESGVVMLASSAMPLPIPKFCSPLPEAMPFNRPSPEPLPAPPPTVEPLPLIVVSLSLTLFEVVVGELLTELEDELPMSVIELPERLRGIVIGAVILASSPIPFPIP